MTHSGVRYFVAIMALLFGFSAPGAANQEPVGMADDVLVPQKGHSLFGTLQRATSTEILFDTDSSATITLTWDKVKELQIHHRTTVQSKKPLSSESPAKSLDLDNLTIQQVKGTFTIAGPARNIAIPTANLVSISSAPPATVPSAAWTISIAPKASLASGTQTQQNLGAQISVRREHEQGGTDWHHQTTTLILDATNSLTKQVGTASVRTHEYDGTFEHIAYLWRGLYANGLGEGYHNSSLNLYLQQSYGGGVGKRVFDDDRNSIELVADFLYIAEHFYGVVPSVGFAGARLTERYTVRLAKLKGGPLYLFETGNYTPAFNQKKAWQVRGAAGIVVPVSTAFTINLSFFDNYLENAPNARKNYSTSSVGVTYTFPSPQK